MLTCPQSGPHARDEKQKDKKTRLIKYKRKRGQDNKIIKITRKKYNTRTITKKDREPKNERTKDQKNEYKRTRGQENNVKCGAFRPQDVSSERTRQKQEDEDTYKKGKINE